MVGIAPDQAHRVLLQQKLPALQRAYVQGALSDPPPGKSRFDYWQVMKDVSIEADDEEDADLCVEIATPIIRPNDSLDPLIKVVSELVNRGADVNLSCALQVHIDVASPPALGSHSFNHSALAITRAYAAFEPALDLLIDPDRRQCCYAANLRKMFQDNNQDLFDDCISLESCSFYWDGSAKIQPRPGYGTIEYRALQGTLQWGLILSWASVAEALSERALTDPEQVLQIWQNPDWRDHPEKNLECLQRFLDKPLLHHSITTLLTAANTPRPENTGRGRGRLALRPGGLWRRGRG
jgi:hypothetical protein